MGDPVTADRSDTTRPEATRHTSDEPVDRNRGLRGLTSGLGWRPDHEPDHLYPPLWNPTPKGAR